MTRHHTILTLDVGAMAHGGHCVARHEGRVVFVRHAIPGEVVRARLTEAGEKARFWRADVIEVVEPSDYRRRHVWKLADSLRAYEMDRLPVGGAEYGHISDAHQRRLKAQVFRDTMQRIGGFGGDNRGDDFDVHVEEICDEKRHGLHWRTRVSFAVSETGSLSMTPHRSHDLLEVRGMPLAVEAISESRIFSGDFRGAHRVDVVAPGAGQTLALVVYYYPLPSAEAARESVAARMKELAEHEPAIGTILLAQTPLAERARSQREASGSGRATGTGGNGRATGNGVDRNGSTGRSSSAGRNNRSSRKITRAVPQYEVLLGNRTVEEPLPVLAASEAAEQSWETSPAGSEALESLGAPSGRSGQSSVPASVELRPEGFWQIHRQAPAVLSAAVASMARLSEGDSVADLYAGAGLFTAWAAEAVGPSGAVVGIEAAEPSSMGAQQLFAGMGHVQTVQAPVERALDVLENRDLIILDPPRAGAGPKVVKALDDAAPRQIIYVSCEPSSFARDAKDLVARGWKLEKVTVHDLYPNTHHMESVASFVR